MNVAHWILVATTAALALASAPASIAQIEQAHPKFPSKPIRLIVGFTAGGTPDSLARLIGPKMSERWGQPVIVENRAGASGTLAADHVAKSAPDGYTLLVTSPSFVFGAALQPKLPYDPIKDFAGVTSFGASSGVLVVAPSLGVKSLKDFIALAQAQPGKILASSPGVGSANHFAVERFRLLAGIKITHVGFKGQPESLIEIAGNRIHFSLAGLGPALPLINDGKLQALTVYPRRSPLLLDVPLITDTLPGWRRSGVQCLLAPAGTPRPILIMLSNEVARVLELPDVKSRLQTIDFNIEYGTPEELDRGLRADIASAIKLVADAGLKPK